MCLLALFYRAVEDAAVIVGANREEAYARGGEPPQLLDGPCRAIGGIDPVARGTWLGLNQHGVLVAITNRPKSNSTAVRSRGLLVRDLLGQRTARDAAALAIKELDGSRYAGCNILSVDKESASVIHAGDWLRVRPLPPGIHALTSSDLDDTGDRRIAHTLGWLGRRSYANAEECALALKELCSEKGNGHPALCLHGALGGTVSSSIVIVRSPLSASCYLHAQGAPDQVPFASYSHLLGELTASGQT
jgi:uncharacterized protein with NRDE domain